MKHIKYCLLLLLNILLFPNVYASCTYKEQIQLNSDISNIKIISEITNSAKINITIYNLTENIHVVYNDPITEDEVTIKYYNSDNGKYVLERDQNNIENYSFELRSSISNCYGTILSTKKIVKPKYNEYSELDICKNNDLKNHTYCQKYITQDINKTKTEVIKTLEDYLSSRVQQQTTEPVIQESFWNPQKIITYSIGPVIIIIITVLILLLKKKRSEL